jgi:hypothetical protein
MNSKYEKELMASIWSPEIKDSPLKFVNFIFEWDKPGTPLHNFKGPRAWQKKILLDLERAIARNQGDITPEMFRQAVA